MRLWQQLQGAGGHSDGEEKSIEKHEGDRQHKYESERQHLNSHP